MPSKTSPTRDVRYLIVGGGMTADAAVQGIRQRDGSGAIVVVGAESDPPYKRPPLTKGLWSGEHESTIWLHTEDTDGLELLLGRRIVAVDVEQHTALDHTGAAYRYEKLLLATGAVPRQLPQAEGVIYFRTLENYRYVRERAVAGTRAVVIGGGFIGSEIAASLVGAGCAVTMVFPEPAIGWRLLPAGLAQFLSGYYRERGVEVVHDETVGAANGTSVTLGSGRSIAASLVIGGLGVEPATELATAAGLAVENGVLVDEYGHADGQADVFAAGDVANFPSLPLGKRFRIEHEDHAWAHGRAVGANMAGADVPYDYLPLFYSDMFDLGYEAVGEVDSRLPQLAHWREPNRAGVVAYTDPENRPRGFLLWNTWEKVEIARTLIRGGQPLELDDLASSFS